VEGILKAIRVEEGERVHSGDLLAEMENLELSNSYEDTRGELATQQVTLQMLQAGARPEEIDKARRQVETKRAELDTAGQVEQELKVLSETVAKKEVEVLNAEANYLRTQKLLKDGLISKNDAERDQTAYAVQQKELSEAKGQLKVLEERTDRTKQVKIKELAQAESELRILLAGTRKEAIEAMEAGVKKLEDKKNNLAQQLECLKIRSPIEGVVATPYLKNRLGQYLNKGDSFCDIVSEGVVIIDMPVPEKEIADVQAGLPITLKVRGYPSRAFQAKVMTIAPIAVEMGTERMVVVQGELENSDGSLKSGMTGVGKILCGKRMILQLASRRALRWLRTEFWEYLP
jgi:multidrug resistance efflux pump